MTSSTDPLFTSILSDMQRFRREVDTLFSNPPARAGIRNTLGNGEPTVSVGETHEDIRVWAFAPGLDEKSIDVSVQGNLLRIAASSKSTVDTDGPNGTFASRRVTVFRNERNRGRFSRLLALPDSVDASQVTALYKDGVLAITLAKKPEVQPRRIEVSTH